MLASQKVHTTATRTTEAEFRSTSGPSRLVDAGRTFSVWQRDNVQRIDIQGHVFYRRINAT